MGNKQAQFITIEGTEGVGKSTAVELICDYFSEKKIPYVSTREPGGTEISEAIRNVLLNKYNEPMASDTELLLMFASRAQHIAQVIKPALEKGQWVLCDRFTDASYAYQGGGRDLGKERIEALEKWVHPNLQPNLTLLLDAPVEVAFGRIENREKDRIEQEKYSFFEKVRQTYLERAERYKDRYRVIDAARSLEEVKQQLYAAIEE